MKYRVIGDIHGRSNWHKLVDGLKSGDLTVIFVGDYTDPYYGYEKNVSTESMFGELDMVIGLKELYPDNVILLFGNHDQQYVDSIYAETNRFDRKTANEINRIFNENKDKFSGVAYQIGNKYLITHAGVTKNWYEKYFGEITEQLDLNTIVTNINKLWEENKASFRFENNVTKFSDCYGTSSTHSPTWVRPNTLWEHNIFGFESKQIQIVGHTAFECITDFSKSGLIGTYGTEKRELTEEERVNKHYYIVDEKDDKTCRLVENDNEHVDIISVDCLRTESACIEIDEELNWKKYTGEK